MQGATGGAVVIATTGSIPSVLGLSEANAKSVLKAAGFIPGVMTTVTTGATDSNNGKVSVQSAVGPGNLFSVAVDLVLFKDLTPPSGTIPSVLGLSEANARSALIAAGYIPGIMTTVTTGATDSNNGNVSVQSAVGSGNLFTVAVDLVLFKDLTPPSGIIPSVLGLTFRAATSLLISAGFFVEEVSYTSIGATMLNDDRVAAQSVLQGSPILSTNVSLVLFKYQVEIFDEKAQPMKFITFFKSGSSVLTNSALKEINDTKAVIRKNTSSTSHFLVTVTGSVTPTRSKAADLKLAAARAKSVILFMKKGDSTSVFKTVLVRGKSADVKNRNSSLTILQVLSKT